MPPRREFDSTDFFSEEPAAAPEGSISMNYQFAWAARPVVAIY
jgi:hypothetical protein